MVLGARPKAPANVSAGANSARSDSRSPCYFGQPKLTYIPLLRVLREDIPPLGYEGHQPMLVYRLPAQRWAEDAEDLITEGARRLVKSLQAVGL